MVARTAVPTVAPMVPLMAARAPVTTEVPTAAQTVVPTVVQTVVPMAARTVVPTVSRTAAPTVVPTVARTAVRDRTPSRVLGVG